jgi:AcrR family transcriptional regulator
MAEEIVATSLAMVRAEGAANLSVREVAERMEYSSAALYRYFPDKAALVDEIGRRGFVELARRLRAVPTDLPPAERLLATGLAYLRFAADEPHLYTLMFVDVMPGEPSAPAPIEARHLLNDDAFAALHAVLADGASAGAFRLSDEQLLPTALAHWSLVHGYAMLRARFPRAFDEATARLGLENFTRGIAARR